MPSATVKLKPDSLRTWRPSSTFVPSMRMTIGHLDAEIAGRRDDTGGQRVAAQNAAEDIDEHGLHALVGEQNAEGVLHLIGIGAAADVEKVGGAAAGVFDDVHGGHGETRAVHHAGDVAIELDVVEAEFRGFHFERIFFVQIAELDEVFVAEEGVVVEVDLGVERVDFVVFGDDEGIDFGERGIHIEAGLRERNHRGCGAGDGRGRDADPEGQIARLIRHQAEAGLDKFFDDRLGSFRGDFFDLHAAGGGRHEGDLAGRTIENDAEVKLPLDGKCFFDEHAVNHAALRAPSGA